MNHQAVSNYGKDCPVCHGTGWELEKRDIPGYGVGHPFAKPCTSCKGKRRPMDLTGVPSQYRDTDLSKFKFNAYSENMEKFEKIVHQYFDNYESIERGLYLWSKTPGTGKTFLSCSLGKSIMMRYDLRMRFITVPNYLTLVGESYKRQQGSHDESQIYRECELLIFDDFGKQKSGEWQQQEIFRIIDERANTGKRTFFTSNVLLEQLDVDEATKSRIENVSLIFQMPEESIRHKNAAAKQAEIVNRLLEG